MEFPASVLETVSVRSLHTFLNSIDWVLLHSATPFCCRLITRTQVTPELIAERTDGRLAGSRRHDGIKDVHGRGLPLATLTSAAASHESLVATWTFQCSSFVDWYCFSVGISSIEPNKRSMFEGPGTFRH